MGLLKKTPPPPPPPLKPAGPKTASGLSLGHSYTPSSETERALRELKAQNEELRNSQGELADLKQKFQELFDLAPVGYITLDSIGSIVEINRAGCDFFGADAAALHETLLQSRVAAESREAFTTFLRQAFHEKRKAQIEIWMHRADGELFAAQVSGVVSESFAEGPQCLLTVVDITERRRAQEELQRAHAELEKRVEARTADLTKVVERLKAEIGERRRAEEALRRSEWLYRTFAANFPNGAIILFDRELRYLLVDGAGLADLGMTKDRMEGKQISQVFPPEVARNIEPLYRSVLAGQSKTMEAAVADRVFETIHVPIRNQAGEVIAGMVMMQNITKRKKAEDALVKYHQKLEEKIAARTGELERANEELRKQIAAREACEEEAAKK
jgi:PAS domain S-box-containing protein